MFGNSTPEALAARFTAVAHQWVAEGPAERMAHSELRALERAIEILERN